MEASEAQDKHTSCRPLYNWCMMALFHHTRTVQHALLSLDAENISAFTLTWRALHVAQPRRDFLCAVLAINKVQYVIASNRDSRLESKLSWKHNRLQEISTSWAIESLTLEMPWQNKPKRASTYQLLESAAFLLWSCAVTCQKRCLLNLDLQSPSAYQIRLWSVSGRHRKAHAILRWLLGHKSTENAIR